jgi:hypothetical protein
MKTWQNTFEMLCVQAYVTSQKISEALRRNGKYPNVNSD